MISPRYHPMAMLGLGSSIGTPPEGVTADVLVVTSFDDLKAKASKVCVCWGGGGGRGEGERCYLLVHVHLVENIIFRLLNFFTIYGIYMRN